MNIIKNSKDYLTIIHRPWKLPLFILLWAIGIIVLIIINHNKLSIYETIGYLFSALLLLFFAYLTAKKSCMYFDAKTQILVWLTEKPFKTLKGQCTLSDIKNIIIRHRSDTEGVDYRLEIVLYNNKFIPVVPHFSTIEEHEDVRAKIEKWLKLNTKATQGKSI